MKKKVVNKSFKYTLKIEVLGCKIKNGEIYVQLSINGRSKWIEYSICRNYADDLK